MSLLFKDEPLDDGPKSDCHLTIEHLNFIRTLWLSVGLLIPCSFALIVSCVSIPVSTPQGPGGDVLSYDATGFTVNAQGHDHMLREGALPSVFTVTPQGFHITNGEFHDFNQIRVK